MSMLTLITFVCHAVFKIDGRSTEALGEIDEFLPES